MKVFVENKYYKLEKATPGSAGIDLALIRDETIYPLDRIFNKIQSKIPLYRTGTRVQFPPNTFGIVALRSGIARKGIHLANHIGIIDNDYRGEIYLALYTSRPHEIKLEKYTRVAQLIILPTINYDIAQVEQINRNTARGENGFNSTGEKAKPIRD